MADVYGSPLSPHLVHRQRSRNCVVGRDDVGKARPSCYDLPPDDYVYGSAESAAATGQGVRDALVWHSHTPSPSKKQGVDYQRVNREAPRHHVTSPSELAEFRVDHDFRLSPPRGRRGPPPAVVPSDVVPGYAYGLTVERPSPPMGALLSHQFGRDEEELVEERYRRYDEEKARSASKLKIKFTKAAGSWRRPPPPEPEDPMKLWKMKKFDRAQAPPPRHLSGGDGGPPHLPQTDSSSRPLSSSSTASLPELPQAVRPERAGASRTSLLEETLLAGRAGGQPPSDAECDTEAGSERSRVDEGDSRPCTPRLDRGHGGEDSGSPEDDASESDEPVEVKATPGASKRTETLVQLLLTVSHELPEELNAATHAMAGCIRSHFPDSFVRVKQVALEQPRQGMREQQSRYMAWGSGALRGKPEAAGQAARVMSPVTLSLVVRHASLEELHAGQRAIIERLGSFFPEGFVRLRGLRPPLPKPATSVEEGQRPSPPGKQQLRFREEVSMQEDAPMRYPLRPRTRDGQPRRSKPCEAPSSPPRSPWK